METGRLYAMTIASIDVRWLERIGGDLCRRSWAGPHWEKRSGQVVALEKVSLFGLVIVAGRKVNYARTSDSAVGEAREIFLQEALVAGELGGRYPFFQHNRSMIDQLHDMEHRTRRHDILVDDATIYTFYDKRLGAVYDRHSLNRAIKKQRNDRFLWMTEEDIVQAAVATDELYQFPDSLHAGEQTIHLEHCFEPGSEADGITANIPVSLIEHFNPVLFEWLVPGLLEEKILALLKGLPKKLRRQFVPLPETSARIMDTLELYQGSLYVALEKSIFKLFHIKINRSEWHPEKLQPHLKMRFRLIDENMKVLHTSRTYRDLLYKSTQVEAPPAGGHIIQETPKAVKNIRTWDFPEPPKPVPLKSTKKTLAGFLYPILVTDKTTRSVELHYTPDRQKSLQQNRDGLRLLYGLQFTTEVKAVERDCKQAVTSHFASWLSLGMEVSAAELTTQLKNFLLDEMFSIEGDPLPSGKEFEANVSAARKKGVIKTCRSQMDLLLKLLTQRRRVSSRIDTISRSGKGKQDPWTALSVEFLEHLHDLLPSDFLAHRKIGDLQHVPRYLKALEIRMERAEHSLAKDTRKAQQVAIAANRLKELSETADRSADCLRCLSEYREMVEEYRVSVFAPELGTPFPVSEKRLKKKWQEAENICHRVE
jgi:ATP-dependent helicase HrpA